MAFALIRANFDVMWDTYPAHPKRNEAVNKTMDYIHSFAPGATSCCVQLSYAFNRAGLKVPRFSYRRQNYDLDPREFAFGSVDEVAVFLSGRFGATENIHSGGRNDYVAMENYIRGKEGVLAFLGTPGREHVELWNGQRIRQFGGPDGMNEKAIFGNPQVYFWTFSNTDTPDQWDIPEWLQGWWYVSDGNPYWYYFGPQGNVLYTKRKPARLDSPPQTSDNIGRCDYKEDSGKAIVTWNPRGGASTIETFKRIGDKAISGTSNRFGGLWGNKV